MSVRLLTQFLGLLDKADEVARVTAEVSADLEIAEIVRRCQRERNATILFDNVTGRATPIVANCFGSEHRICLALGADSVSQLSQRLIGDESSSKSWMARLASGLLPHAGESLAPRGVKTAACQQVVKIGRDVDLNALAALRCGDAETVSSLTAAYVVSADPSGEQRNLTKVDLPVIERNQLAVRWQPHEALARHFSNYSQLGTKMPVAVVLGGPPAALFASYAACLDQLDGYLFAGVLADGPIDLTTCRTHELQVPADAELIIEGYIDPHEEPPNVGPIATSDGCYSAASPALTIEVVQITQQSDVILPAFVHTAPPNEETAISSAIERVMLPVWQRTIPELHDFYRPAYSGRQQIAFASINKSYLGQGQKVAHALRGHAGTMSNKLLVIVDDDCDLRDENEVWRRVAIHSSVACDLINSNGLLTIDATTHFPGEDHRPSTERIVPHKATQQSLDGRWSELGLS
jgi:4-hydroxy-3-polyprenylbenzoate decarboxylase